MKVFTLKMKLSIVFLSSNLLTVKQPTQGRETGLPCLSPKFSDCRIHFHMTFMISYCEENTSIVHNVPKSFGSRLFEKEYKNSF